jgi:WD40 repeat protein
MRRLCAAGFVVACFVAFAAGQPARVDFLGDPLPPGALARFGTLRLEPGCRAWAIALSPDGQLLATGGEEGTLRIWETAGGKELKVFDCKDANPPKYVDFGIRAVVFVPGPDGLQVAAGTIAGKFRVWDVQSGKLILEGEHKV